MTISITQIYLKNNLDSGLNTPGDKAGYLVGTRYNGVNPPIITSRIPDGALITVSMLPGVDSGGDTIGITIPTIDVYFYNGNYNPSISNPVPFYANATMLYDDDLDGWVSQFDLPDDVDDQPSYINALAGTVNRPQMYNGQTWDRFRLNNNVTVLASAARTTATDSAAQVNYSNRGAHFIINVTAYTAGSITPSIQGQDPVSGEWYDVLVGLAMVATGIQILKIYPGIGEIVNGAASDILPRDWRVHIAVSTADSVTYSVGATLIL